MRPNSAHRLVREALIAFAMPKSVTTAAPPESRMFSGLMSRCTTPCAVRIRQRARDVAQDADAIVHRRAARRQPVARAAIRRCTNGIV